MTTDRRYRFSLLRRREERALRSRWARLLAAGGPIADDPIELTPERVCLRTGRLLDRRAKVRNHPTDR